MGFFKGLVQRGWGISSTTTSWTPFDSKTKTPEAKNAPQALRKNEKHPEMPANKVAPVPTYSSTGNQIKQNLLDQQNKKNGFVANLKNPRGHLDLLRNKKYFPQGRANQLDEQVIKTQLEAVRIQLDAQGRKLPDQIANGDMTVLTLAIALACKGSENPMAEGARGLACLRNLNLLDGIRNPQAEAPQENVGPPCPNVGVGRNSHDDAKFDRKDLACAWRIAQMLEMTPNGFATLKAITRASAAPGHPVSPSVAAHDDIMLHVYLQASREKIKEAATQGVILDADPFSLQTDLNGVDERSKTLLDKGLGMVRKHLEKSHEHASAPEAANTPFIYKHEEEQGPNHEWAVVAIRNGVYTDKLEDANGNPTLFAKMQGRTDKLQTWISRSTGEKVKTGKSVKRTFKQLIAPQVDKSPFNAYNRLGSGEQGAGFKNTEEGGIGEGRAIKEGMILNLEAALKTQGAAGDQPLVFPVAIVNPDDPDEQNTLRNMVRLSILEQAKEDVRFLPRYTRADPLDEVGSSKVKARVMGWLQGGAEGQSNKTKALLETLILQNEGGLTPDRLVEWAAKVGGPADLESAVPEPGAERPQVEPGKPDWHAFGMAVNRAVNGNAEHVETPHMKDLDATGVADVIEGVMQHQELGSRATLYSGGVFGFGTKGLSETVLGAPFLWLFRPRIDIRGERTRYAAIDFGTSTQGNELFLGTQRIQKGQGGGGGFLGLGKFSKKGVKFGAGVGVDAATSYEGTDQRGVLFRLPRLITAVNGDAENNKKLGRIFRKLADPNTPPPNGVPYINAPGEDGNSSLKNLWQEWPELSISMVGLKEHAGRGGVSAYGGFAGGYDKYNAGFSAGGGIEGKKSTQAWTETGGSLHVGKKVSSWNVKANLSGTLASISAFVNAYTKTTTEMVNGQAQEHSALAINQNFPLLGEFLTGSADIWKTGTTRKDTFIEQDGELKKATFRTVTYANAASFVAAVAPRLDTIAEQKAAKYEAARYGKSIAQGNDMAHLSTEEVDKRIMDRMRVRNDVLEREHKILSQHLAEALKNADPTQSFQEYFELTDSALAMLNELKSSEAMAAHLGDKAVVKDCQRAMNEIIENDDAWETAFLVDNTAVSEQRTRGLNIVAKYQQVDGIIKTNMRTFN